MFETDVPVKKYERNQIKANAIDKTQNHVKTFIFMQNIVNYAKGIYRQ
jgi:hypothetical protein